MTARELLRRETGLDLSAAVAERAVASRMAQLGQTDREAYLRKLQSTELKALIELVVVPESWMFRDPDAFHAATRFVRDKLGAAPAHLVRILSIPCAGGEEPYSIAMALKDAGVPAAATAIEAVDLSDAALARARQGRYTKNAFRGADLSFRERHFTQVGSEYQIDASLREQVSFSQGNLLAIDAQAGAGRYDIIFCRNLLIYFDEATAAAAIARLRTLLADDGILFAGYAEVPAFCSKGFTPLRVPGVFALQKERCGERAAPQAPPTPMRAHVQTAGPAPSLAARRTAPTTPAAPAASPAPSAPGPAQLLRQASSLADAGEHGAARDACKAVLALEPHCADAYFILGLVAECEKQSAVAADHWRRCVYLQPDHYEALCHLALLADENGDAAQAASFKERAARIYSRRDDDARKRAR